MSEEIKKSRGLSYSSFTEYSSCPRKWFYRKVLNTPIDSDSSDDTEAFLIGKSFHKALEDCKHNLTGFTFQDCINVCASFDIEDLDTVCMIFAMLLKYKKVHSKTSLKVVSCETVIDTPLFYGIIDAVMYEEGVGFWIVDLKTAGSWQNNTVTSASTHPQLNIYSKYSDEIAFAVGMKHIPFAGCRLRVTTKSRLSRRNGEGHLDFINRMAAGIRSADIVVPAKHLKVSNIAPAHEVAAKKILQAKENDVDSYPQNFSNCYSFSRPCGYWSKCYSCNYSDMPKLEVIE